MTDKNLNTDPVTIDETEVVEDEVTRKTRFVEAVKRNAKRAILPVIAVVGGAVLVVLNSHGKRLDEIEDDVDAITYYLDDDEDSEDYSDDMVFEVTDGEDSSES